LKRKEKSKLCQHSLCQWVFLSQEFAQLVFADIHAGCYFEEYGDFVRFVFWCAVFGSKQAQGYFGISVKVFDCTCVELFLLLVLQHALHKTPWIVHPTMRLLCM